MLRDKYWLTVISFDSTFASPKSIIGTLNNPKVSISRKIKSSSLLKLEENKTVGWDFGYQFEIQSVILHLSQESTIFKNSDHVFTFEILVIFITFNAKQ